MNPTKSFFTLNLPQRPKEGDIIKIVAKLKNKPKIFRLLLGVKNTQPEKSNLEPKLVAFEFKALFNEKKEVSLTSNWKTQNGWQEEIEIDETDWLDEQTGLFDLNLNFKGSSMLHVNDGGNSSITRFKLHYDLNTIDSVHLFGDVAKVETVLLKYF